MHGSDGIGEMVELLYTADWEILDNHHSKANIIRNARFEVPSS